jgi:hypothetical protein
MNVASDSRNSGSFHLGFDKKLIALVPDRAFRCELVESLRTVRAFEPLFVREA